MTYKAVGFDYGGVITGDLSGDLGKDIANLLDVSESQYKEAYYHHNINLNRGTITWNELWRAVLKELDRVDKYDQLMTYLMQLNFGKSDQLIIRLVITLRKEGFKTGLLSNNTRETAVKIRKGDFAKYFDVIDISAETGLVKPEPAAFTHFARELHIEPSELIFIDDSTKSLSTAAQVGYKPIHYMGFADLIDQLKILGLPV